MRPPSCSREPTQVSGSRARLHGLIALPVLAALLSGCGESKQSNSVGPTSKPATEAKGAEPAPAKPAVNFSGVVTGIVKLAPGATLPLGALPGDSADTKLAIPPGCAPPSEADRKTVTQHAQTQGLFPAHVALTQMSAAPPREPRTVELAIEDCRLTPGLVGAMRGDTLKVTNRSQAVFLPNLPGDAFMQGLMAGKSREVKLEHMGPANVQCGFAGYCGQSMVVTLAHSLYAVTDAEGRFKIEGVPLDQELQIHAWHPLFQVATVPVKLSAAESSKSVELLLTPAPAPASAPAGAKDTRAPTAKAPAAPAPKKAPAKQP